MIDKLKRLRNELKEKIDNELLPSYANALAIDVVSSLDAIIEGEGDGWISVDDRLPEKMQNVLVYGKGNLEYTHYRTACYLGNKHFSTTGIQSNFIPTHWMPLPQPPKQS